LLHIYSASTDGTGGNNEELRSGVAFNHRAQRCTSDLDEEDQGRYRAARDLAYNVGDKVAGPFRAEAFPPPRHRQAKGGRRFDVSNDKPSTTDAIVGVIEFQPDCAQDGAATADELLTKAGARLAYLLRRIWQVIQGRTAVCWRRGTLVGQRRVTMED
jgi:hypothetical protein